MIKTIGIVSLSRGILGEDFMEHEVEIGLRRLNEMGLVVKIMPSSSTAAASMAFARLSLVPQLSKRRASTVPSK